MGFYSEEHSGNGLRWVLESADWKVGIKNFKPENSFDGFTDVERHMATDEVYVLLEGTCAIYYLDKDEIKMLCLEKNKVYVMEKATWHNMITVPDTKLILVENKNTSMENSEIRELSPADKDTIKSLYKKISK